MGDTVEIQVVTVRFNRMEAEILMDLLNNELRKSNSTGATAVRAIRERLINAMIVAGATSA